MDLYKFLQYLPEPLTIAQFWLLERFYDGATLSDLSEREIKTFNGMVNIKQEPKYMNLGHELSWAINQSKLDERVFVGWNIEYDPTWLHIDFEAQSVKLSELGGYVVESWRAVNVPDTTATPPQ